MEETYRTALVHVRNTFAGLLREMDAGYFFSSDAAYLQSVGASPD